MVPTSAIGVAVIVGSTIGVFVAVGGRFGRSRRKRSLSWSGLVSVGNCVGMDVDVGEGVCVGFMVCAAVGSITSVTSIVTVAVGSGVSVAAIADVGVGMVVGSIRKTGATVGEGARDGSIGVGSADSHASNPTEMTALTTIDSSRKN